tara:strand:- start:684 stop:1538 length:855 start_codon:yes stop_codon:yes gene_type:complete
MSKQMIAQTRALLQQSKEQIKLALPKHLDVDRVMRTAMTEVNKNYQLQTCDPLSVVGSVIQASELGLECGATLGHAFLVPFNTKNGPRKAQLIVGYRGMLALARRSGTVKTITARTVHENDEFTVQYGLEDNIVHKPAMGDRGEIVAVYAIAKLQGDAYQFEVMSKEEIESVRQTSKSKDNGPWATDWPEMAKKTVIRRLFKFLPISIEDNALQMAASLDEAADRGEQDNSALVVNSEGTPREETSAERLKKKVQGVEEKEVLNFEDAPTTLAEPDQTELKGNA